MMFRETIAVYNGKLKCIIWVKLIVSKCYNLWYVFATVLKSSMFEVHLNNTQKFSSFAQ
jgi:hypothetical protein